MTRPDTAHIPTLPFERASVTELPGEYRELREHRSIVRVRTEIGETAWLVSGYDDIRTVLTDPRFGTRFAGAGAADGADDSLFQDPPGHTRLRRLVNRAFTPRTVEALRPATRALAGRLVRDLVERHDADGSADLVAGFAFPMSGGVLSELLGVPFADRDAFRRWIEIGHSLVPCSAEAVEEATGSVHAYAEELIAAKRVAPGDDILSELIAVRDEGGDRFTAAELVAMVLSILGAGYVTVANAISTGVLTLLLHPDEYARLRADAALVPAAVEEMLRHGFDIGGLQRTALADVRIRDTLIRRGDAVLAQPVSGDRDAGRFPEPDRFDIDRRDSGHLAFGAGIHHCLGAAISRMELQEGFAALLGDLPVLRPAVPIEEIPFHSGMLGHGPSVLPVRW